MQYDQEYSHAHLIFFSNSKPLCLRYLKYSREIEDSLSTYFKKIKLVEKCTDIVLCDVQNSWTVVCNHPIILNKIWNDGCNLDVVLVSEGELLFILKDHALK